MSDETSLRRDIVEVGRRLYAKGFIAGTEGNVSVREGDRLYVTPGGACKGFLKPEETLEQSARIALVARLLGGQTELDPQAVARLEALRVPAGYPPPPQTPRQG